MYAKIDKMKKIPILTFLQALGLSQKKIFYSINNFEFLKNLEQGKIVESCEEALSLINEVINEQKLNFVRLIFQFLNNISLRLK